jgi:parvulin-like peptidyl-prolyl isomerase
MIRVLAFGLLVVACWPSGTAQDSASDRGVVARAGSLFISEQEFLERFELLPAFGRQRASQVETAKLELLYSMIAEKLLAQHAAESGIDRDTLVRLGIAETRKLLARDELYREEIIQKVDVSSEEAVRGEQRAVRQVTIRYIFFPREEDARFLRSHLRRPTDFNNIQLDSSYNAVRDTATVIFGDAEEAIEQAAYSLKKGEVSPVVRAGTGWYVLSPTAIARNPYYASMTPDVLRERVVTLLRRRKERARLDDYLAEALKGKTGYARPGPLRVLSEVIQKICRESSRDSVVFITPPRREALRSRVGSALKDTIAVAGEKSWLLGEVIDRMAAKGFSVPQTGVKSLPARLNTEMRIMVQQELLAQEGIRRGLDTIPQVRRKVEIWSQYFLAGGMRDSLRHSVTVSEPEVWAYRKSLDTGVAVPRVRIRELRTATYAEMQEALVSLQHGSSWGQVVSRWSNDQEVKKRGGLSDFFPVTERPPVGSLAATMKVGERYGPITVPGGVLFFELAAKTAPAAPGDTSGRARADRAYNDFRSMKERRAVTMELARLGKQMGFEIYSDRLRILKVSPVPMMTFRILGFGGRMFEVPFVEPELDWLNVDSSQDNILP